MYEFRLRNGKILSPVDRLIEREMERKLPKHVAVKPRERTDAEIAKMKEQFESIRKELAEIQQLLRK